LSDEFRWSAGDVGGVGFGLDFEFAVLYLAVVVVEDDLADPVGSGADVAYGGAAAVAGDAGHGDAGFAEDVCPLDVEVGEGRGDGVFESGLGDVGTSAAYQCCEGDGENCGYNEGE
jgi:hypothetical protein